MSISMQGSWTVCVKGRNAAYAQRFVVSGAATGNGTYDGTIGTAVFVTGAQWSLQVQHRPTRLGWRDSAQRLGLPGVCNGLLRFEIGSNDGGLDDDCDDLVLVCSLPVSGADHVVYGRASAYASSALFNPSRDDCLLIDPLNVAAACARYPDLHDVIRKLHPQRMPSAERRFATAMTCDPTPFVIPGGLPNVSVGLAFFSQPVSAVDMDGGRTQDELVDALQATVRRMPFRPSPSSLAAGAGLLTRSEQDAIARLRESAVRLRGPMEPAPGVVLRFQRYERTTTEALDGAYTGTGLREELGFAVADERGSYLFRFRQRADATSRPDVVVQANGGASMPGFESALYDDVANLRRIDLCIPDALVRRRTSDAHERPAAPLVIDSQDPSSVNRVRSFRWQQAA